MTFETIVALTLLVIAVFCHLVLAGIHYGAFDAIIVRLNNYIVSRIERLEKDI